jgi:hypothetical protein
MKVKDPTMNVKEYLDGDIVVVERETSARDLVERIHQRIFRDQRRGHPARRIRVGDRSREVEYRKRRALRIKRRKAKVCTSCRSDEKLTDGFRMCSNCRTKWRLYNSRCEQRKLSSLTPYPLPRGKAPSPSRIACNRKIMLSYGGK